jgi:hypothetical protein
MTDTGDFPPQAAPGHSPWLYRTPILGAALLICLVNGYNLQRLVRAEAPRNPWEAAEVVEAWRSLQGMPVYERTPEGHATHMYGALVPWVQGEIFRWVGPSNVSGRVLSLVSALLTVTLLAVTLRGDRSVWLFAVAWALLLGVNHRTLDYFAENRPDMPALLLATVAVFLMARGQTRGRWGLVVLGTAFLVLAFFFKQTMLVLAGVPAVALVWRGGKPARAEVARALLPLGLMGGVLLVLKIVCPTVYFYMIEVPGSYALSWPRAPRVAWELLLDSPLVLVLLGEWIIYEKGSARDDPRLLWLAAVLTLTLPSSALTAAKFGGMANCTLPAILPLMAFAGLRLPRLLRPVETAPAGARPRLALGAFLAVLMLMTAFPHISRQQGLILPRPPYDRAYAQAIAAAKALPGTVICPEDPTIPLYGKQHAGRNIFVEYDAHPVDNDWPTMPPEPVVDEIQRADYVIDVQKYFQDIVKDKLLVNLGYEPVDTAGLDPACYRVWRRKTTATALRSEPLPR